MFYSWLSIWLCVASSVYKSSSILNWRWTAGSALGHEHYAERPHVILCCVKYPEYLRHKDDDDNNDNFYVNVLALNLHITISLFYSHLIIDLWSTGLWQWKLSSVIGPKFTPPSYVAFLSPLTQPTSYILSKFFVREKQIF